MNILKMHGLGNDFIMFTEKEVQGIDLCELAKKLCVRRLSVGADGIIIAENSDKADIRMRIINADGSEAEMCGNGIRCFAKMVYEKGLVKKTEMEVETLAGIMKPSLILDGDIVKEVRVDMGMPNFNANAIPVKAGTDPMNINMLYNGKNIAMSSVLMGVPHTVVITDDIEKLKIEHMGPFIENNEIFPKKTNVNFVEIKDRNNVFIKTWERGAGATLACGTGACAAGVICEKKGLTENTVFVHSAAGTLKIEYSGKNVFMTGKAEYVFDGKII